MTDPEFTKALGTFRRMVATLDAAADVVGDPFFGGDKEERDASVEALADLTARVKSALESVGFDVDEWLAEDEELETAIVAAQAARPSGALVDPTGQNRTGAARWHAERAATAVLETDGSQEAAREVRDKIWRDYQAEKKRLEDESLRNERGLPGEEDER